MNRCKLCNRFARWEELMFEERMGLTLYGDLIQEWFFTHKGKCPPTTIEGHR